jgi:hypothetical protein
MFGVGGLHHLPVLLRPILVMHLPYLDVHGGCRCGGDSFASTMLASSLGGATLMIHKGANKLSQKWLINCTPRIFSFCVAFLSKAGALTFIKIGEINLQLNFTHTIPTRMPGPIHGHHRGR